MSSPPLHPDLAPLTFLLGTWRGSGTGDYPTIDDFAYVEEATFSHVGKPFIAYTQKTRDAGTDLPLHAEVGYLRPTGATTLEMLLVQPSGIGELLEGTVEGTAMELASVRVVTTATAKECTATTRSLRLDGDDLHYTLAMAAVGQPLQHHLTGRLQRVG